MNVPLLRTPKYRRHKSTGQAVVTIVGRDFYLGKHNSAASHERYRRLIAEYLQTGNAPSVDARSKIAVVEVLVAYKRFASDYYCKAGKRTGLQARDRVKAVGGRNELTPGRSGIRSLTI